MAGDIQNKVLRPALYHLMEGGPEAVDFKKREVSVWVSSQARLYSSAWQSLYFEWLWTVLDEKEDVAALRPWFEKLKSLSQDTLEKAISRAPSRAGRSYRAIAQANGAFFGGLFKNFPDYMEEKK
jgi:CRISPR system Cascade subunit CasA